MADTTNQNARATWSPAEIAMLADHYPDMPDRDLVRAFLPGKTVAQVRNKAHKMGLLKTKSYLTAACAVPRKNSWTDQENRVILDNYGTAGPSVVSAMLPGRTYQAIQAQAKKLGVTRHYTRKDTRHE